MAEADRAAVDVQPGAVDLARRAVKSQNLAAEFVVSPCCEAAQHLGGEGLVQLPGLDVLQGHPVALQKRTRRQHRAEAHDRGIERRPLAVEDDGLRRQAVLGHRLLRRQDHPGCAVGDLRGIAGGDLAPGALEHRLQLRQRVRRRIRADAVVMVVELAVA
ncbi:hypothetical protein chiPu_0033851, partial [Chiloscyllium punctatum]|nr:hypothetical protein [Chiloscyllium punctatum]